MFRSPTHTKPKAAYGLKAQYVAPKKPYNPKPPIKTATKGDASYHKKG